MDIGSRLKEVRKGKANQNEIAELLNTTQQQISKYENNIQEIPCRQDFLPRALLPEGDKYAVGAGTQGQEAENGAFLRLFRHKAEDHDDQRYKNHQYAEHLDRNLVASRHGITVFVKNVQLKPVLVPELKLLLHGLFTPLCVLQV